MAVTDNRQARVAHDVLCEGSEEMFAWILNGIREKAEER